ncbi:hypothetical protein [Azoarcus olearius]|uniref:hypothetical protein n=1 Tax=Azoarcus sp. (strain BH72) TaxID=418699 RepID=UPI0012EE25AE|nr:hypothetical protein [Azoarcus olearius]
MATRELVGAEAEALVQEQIRQHSAGIQNSLSIFNARSAVAAWLEALRGVEELINLPLFELEDEQAVLALVSLRLDHLSHSQVANLHAMLADQFEAGVARRFVQTVRRSAAIGLAFRMHGMEGGEEFRTLGGAITYFQSRRRQMVGLLYCMPTACSGTEPVDSLDALNVFLPIVEHSCVGLTSLYRHLVLLRIHDDYGLTVGPQSFKGNYSFDILDESFLEPERVGITEVPRDRVDGAVLKHRMKVDSGRVFSVPELCNDLLAMEAAYAEFKLGDTAFGAMAQFIVACSRDARDQYHIELEASTLKSLMALCGLSNAAQRRLVYAGTGYADAINSFAPFILVGRNYVTTVTLLSRFAYSWKTICLNKIKRFQVRSGFMFEQQVKDALEKQGFFVSDVKRIERKEFDVVATKDCVIYNVQCKNNLVDLTRMEENPSLFARYNRRLDRYYADALRKEEEREGLLKQRFGLGVVKHVVLSKFPVATKNPRILAFREISQFGKQFAR